MKKLFPLAVILLLSLNSWSQLYTVKGTLLDENNKPISFASVLVLNASDSTMAEFALTSNEGDFSISGLKNSSYIVQANYMGYQTFYKNIDFSSGSKEVNLGKVNMEVKDMQLDEVEVVADLIPIRMRGDTLEYLADAFKTQPNATVEDLLKKMPGMEVEKDGTIKAQGEEVKKVLVDGKEFFGSDPKKATKNLPANAVNKVQVFDKKSESAEFSGIDDGNSEKAINLELKEDKRKGYFGTVSAGAGTDQRFESKASINRFDKKTQVSFLGQANNVNEQGFSFDDFVSFQGGTQQMMSGDGMRFGSVGQGFNFSQGLDQGSTNTYAGGLNLNTELSEKTEIGTSYFYNNIRNIKNSNSNRLYALPDSEYTSVANNADDVANQNHNFNLKIKHEIDSTQDIILNGGFVKNRGTSFNNLEEVTFSDDGQEQNHVFSDFNNQNENSNLTSSLIYRKKLKKSGRTLTTTVSSGLSESESEAFLRTINNSQSSSDSIHQQQINNNNNFNYSGRVSYTEPIKKDHFLEVNYRYYNRDYDSEKEVFDIESDGNKTANDSLSKVYDNRYFYHQGGLNYKITKEKAFIEFGAEVQSSELIGNNITDTLLIEKNYLNILPSASYTYRFSKSSRMSVRYRTNVNEPSVEQLQPLVDNSNPLKIYIGNPDLIATYTHRTTLYYSAFSQFTSTSFFAYTNFNINNNPIVSSIETSNGFTQIERPVNADRSYSLSQTMHFGRPLPKLNTKVSLRLSANLGKNKGFINSVENEISGATYSGRFGLENRKKDKIDMYVGFSPSITFNDYSINSEQNSSYQSNTIDASIIYTGVKRWIFGVNADYAMYSGDAFTENVNVPLVGAFVSRFVFKSDRGELKLRVFDALDENKGVIQNTGINYIEEGSTNTLGRIFMLSFTYNLSKSGKEGGFGTLFKQMDNFTK